MTPWRSLASAALSGVAIGLFSGCSSLQTWPALTTPTAETAPSDVAVVDKSVTALPVNHRASVDTPDKAQIVSQAAASGDAGGAADADEAPEGKADAPGMSGDALPDPGTGTATPPEASRVLRDWSDAAVDEPESRADLWERLRRGLNIPDLDDPLVSRWERFYAEKPDYMQRMTERAAIYLYHIVDEIERRGMPLELALLPFIESAFNPQAVSSARAMGMWQFMPATGLQFDLKQNLFRDDRRAVQASTRAALDYLQSLHTMFGDWHLALASYNWGEGNVQRALARNRTARKPATYLALRMPAETRNYVPKLQAIENIVRDPAKFGLKLPTLQNHPYFLSVEVDRDIDVDLVTRLADISADDFRALNPQLNKPVVLAAATPQILLPYDNARRFVRERDNHKGPLASWTAWVAPRTLHPSEAARLVGMGESNLREVNRIPAQMMIRQGSTLLVTRKAHVEQDVTEKVADNAAIKLAPASVPVRKRYVRVGGQSTTLVSMAKLVGVAVADLASWNNLKVDARLKPRQRLVVLTPVADTATASKQRPKAAETKSTPKPAASRSRPARKTR
jgi:membrane-bound lytic murein transglycosylase D